MFEQAAIPVQNQEAYGKVEAALNAAFSPAGIQTFLKKVSRAGLRVRDFELILTRGLLGPDVPAAYGSLQNGDRGLIRERYLSLVEQVSPALRQKFLKVYAYYG